MLNKIIAFYHETEEYGCFSNWYLASFEYAGIKYTSSEQFMMNQKVLMFGQHELSKQIKGTDNPQEQKKLGKTHFPEFSAEIWDRNCYTVVKRGIRAKFQQNDEIKRILLDTRNAVLVEASPLDRIWGVGVGAEKAVDVRTWRGKNLLGRALMEIRMDLKAIPEYIDARDEKSIVVWKWYPAELIKIPQYYSAVVAYKDSLTDDRQIKAFMDCEYTFEQIEDMMRTNMGGGFPVAGFWELKQEIYDIFRKQN